MFGGSLERLLDVASSFKCSLFFGRTFFGQGFMLGQGFCSGENLFWAFLVQVGNCGWSRWGTIVVRLAIASIFLFCPNLLYGCTTSLALRACTIVKNGTLLCEGLIMILGSVKNF